MPAQSEYLSHLRKVQLAEFSLMRRNEDWMKREANFISMGGTDNTIYKVATNLPPRKNIEACLQEFKNETPTPFSEVVVGAWRDLAFMAGRETHAKEILAAEAVLKFVVPKSRVHYKPKQALRVSGFYDEQRDNACSDAEDYFSDVGRSIMAGLFLGYNTDIRVYHDKNYQPVALRKSYEFASSLLLQPMIAGNAYIPHGSIAYFSGDAEITGSAKRGPFKSSTALFNGDLKITPVRFSPWSFEDPLDQAMFALDKKLDYSRDDGTEHPYIDLSRAGMIHDFGLDRFRVASNKVLSMCLDQAKLKAA